MNEARAEKFLRLLTAKDRDRTEYKQMVARHVGSERARLAPIRESTAQALHDGNEMVASIEKTAPDRVRRSREARLDSMIQRLKLLPPELLQAKLKEIQGEFWKLGSPVAYDDLKAVAASYLNNRRVDTNYTPEVTQR